MHTPFHNKLKEIVRKNPFSTNPNGGLSLRQNFAWTFVGNTVFAAAQWAMLIVLAKVGSTEIVGQFALGLAITAPVMLLANLKLRAVLATDSQNEYQFSHYLALRILSVSIAFLVIISITLIMGYHRDVALVIVFIGLAKIFDSLSDILYGYLQQQEYMDRIAISRILQGVAQLFALGGIMLITGNLVFAMLGWAIASGLITFAYDIPNIRVIHKVINAKSSAAKQGENETARNLVPKWNWKTLWKLTLVTLPLGLAVMLGSLWSNIPRYFIEAHLGESKLGIFAAIASLMIVGGTIVGALGQSASPRLAKLHASRKYKDFDRLVIRLVVMGIILGLLGLGLVLIAGRFILSLIFTPEYANYSDVLSWLMVASTIRFAYNFLGTGIQAMRNFKIHLPIQLTSVVIVFALTYFLIGEYGLVGTAWAMLAANLFEAVAISSGFYYVRWHSRKYLTSYSSV